MPFCKKCCKYYGRNGDHLNSKVHALPLKHHCNKCGQGFTSKKAAKRHQAETSCDFPNDHRRCWACGITIISAKKFYKHIHKKCPKKFPKPKSTGPDSNATFCQICRKSFKKPKHLRDHNSDVHKVLIKPSGPTGNYHSIQTTSVASTTLNPLVYFPATESVDAYIDRTNPTGFFDSMPAEDSDSSSDGDDKDDSSSDTDSDDGFTPARGTVASPSGWNVNEVDRTGLYTSTEDTTPQHDTVSAGWSGSFSTPAAGFVHGNSSAHHGGLNSFLNDPSGSAFNDGSYAGLGGFAGVHFGYAADGSGGISYVGGGLLQNPFNGTHSSRGYSSNFRNLGYANVGLGHGQRGGNMTNNSSAMYNFLPSPTFLNSNSQVLGSPAGASKKFPWPCPLCPSSKEKKFQSEVALQMHLQSSVHMSKVCLS